ncbi:hypothetical protein ACTSKR_06960 [Chitinibacteraceae bacterium HSL-7]
MQFDEVLPSHFTTLSRTPFPHTEIDHVLLKLVKENGPAFRAKVLLAAGWKHHNLTPLGKYPADAAAAYNRIRLALADTDDPDALLAQLSA